MTEGSRYIFSLNFLESQGALCCDFDQEAKAGRRHCSRQRFQDVGCGPLDRGALSRNLYFVFQEQMIRLAELRMREGKTLANNGLCREKETNDCACLGEKILLTQQSYVCVLLGNHWR